MAWWSWELFLVVLVAQIAALGAVAAFCAGYQLVALVVSWRLSQGRRKR